MDEASLLQSLRAGEESAFTALVEQYHPSLVRLARLFVRDETIAEELAQDTWLALLQGLERFEGRSSLKTWLFTILTNKSKSRGGRESRTVVFSDLEDENHASDDPATRFRTTPTVDPARFNPANADKFPGHWTTNPATWDDVPETELLSQETVSLIRRAIDELPESQRAVITLRDVDELPSPEICNILGISETNQRVLLHRARAKVRQALEDYLQPENG